MSKQENDQALHWVFPRWTVFLGPLIGVMAGGGLLYAVVFVWFGFSPKTTDVGYAPEQPIPYSHALHVGKLGLDCRYCHTGVEDTAQALVPPTQTCMSCHWSVRAESPKLEALRQSYQTGQPIPWVRVHDLPDYAYFDHSAHVRRGVGCASCHGRVDQMQVVYQHEPLSMSWCLTCHRAPDEFLRPLDQITNMRYPHDPEAARELKEKYQIQPTVYCSTCHR